MKKKLLVAGVALLTTAAVTATVLNPNNKKPTKKETSKCVMKKTHCSKTSNVACY
jgi:hypothetical protein